MRAERTRCFSEAKKDEKDEKDEKASTTTKEAALMADLWSKSPFYKLVNNQLASFVSARYLF